MVQYHMQKEIDIERLRMTVTGRYKDLSRTLAMNLLQKC
jgi:hypothetical protein